MTPTNRTRFVSLGVAMLAVAVLVGWHPPAFTVRLLVKTGSVVALVAATLAFLTTFYRGSISSIRLDWFIPFLRKKKKNEELAQQNALMRPLRWLLPASMFADRVRGKPGWIRRTLKRMGPSMLSSPGRRLIQAFCLIVFLLLFFHVCWPYSAAPDPPGQVADAWALEEIDQQSGHVRLRATNDPTWPIETADTVYVADRSGPQEDVVTIGEYAVDSMAGRVVSLKPLSPLTADQLDAFLTSSGTLEIHEKEPNRWPSHYADDFQRKEIVPAETFLAIDPLVGISTGIASRSWVWSLASAGAILIVCVLIPRGFCGYICPLGTIIDLFDWIIGRRVKRFRLPDDGWWVHIKYYLLSGILICATMGVLISGIFAAIPIVTRAALFLGEPVQSGLFRRWDLVPALNAGHWLSIGLFALVLGLGVFRPRFWCKYVCPSGAVFSLGNLFRLTERKVESSCINCNKCVEICPFDAIKPDFTTRETDCTMCQTCGGVCPTHAIKFVDRWNLVELKVDNDPPTNETALGRRGFLSLAAGTAASIVGGVTTAMVTAASGARLDHKDKPLPVRPPGSVPEREFLQMCIRCGECFKACPNNVLQAEGFQQGLEGLWAPLVNADWAGCESSCNACGQVCPTGAIRELALEEKRVARMGLAIVNQETCLPFAGKEECDLCVVECNAAGYEAIEFQQVHTEVDDEGNPREGSGFLAPIVLADKCVGCGLCQTRCYGINAKDRGVLDKSAIIIEAGDGKEDRMMDGSYIALREEEARQREIEIGKPSTSPKQATPKTNSNDDNPFGTGQGTQESDKTTKDANPFGSESPKASSDDDPFGTSGKDKKGEPPKKKAKPAQDDNPFGID